jgi:alkylglycerol monooxygenase
LKCIYISFFKFSYLKYLLGRALDMKGVTNWVKNFLYGPGWLPGKPRTGDINDIPKVIF